MARLGEMNTGDRTGMTRRATIEDVAKLADVHKATVSRALNARTEHHVGRETVERIRAAADKLGYVPNAYSELKEDQLTYICQHVLEYVKQHR